MVVRPHEHKALNSLTNEYQNALVMQASETGLLRLVKGGYAMVRETKIGSLNVREFKLNENTDRSRES